MNNQSNQNQSFQTKQQIANVEHLVQQLISQTQQASMQYQQLLQQEQLNARTLEQLAQKEQHAAQVIQTALQGHQTATNQLNQIKSLCNQISTSQFTNVQYSNDNHFTEPLYSPSTTQFNSNGYNNH